jgi:hypothetical protein
MVEGGVNKQQRQRPQGNFYVQNRNRLQAMVSELSEILKALQEQQQHASAKEQVRLQILVCLTAVLCACRNSDVTILGPATTVVVPGCSSSLFQQSYNKLPASCLVCNCPDIKMTYRSPAWQGVVVAAATCHVMQLYSEVRGSPNIS